MPKLLLVSGGEPREFDLAEFNSLGRHPDNNIQILDRIISKEHCQIIKTPDNRFLLKDLGSLNGTFIRQDRISEHVLRNGDEINLGSTRLVFQDEERESQALDRVTIAAGMAESHIRQRIDADADVDFHPEKDITDEQQLRRDYERLRITHELGQVIGNELDLDRLLQKILDTAFEILSADRGVILLMNEENRPVPRVAKTRSGGQTDQIVLSNSIVSEVLQRKQAVLTSDAMIDSRFSGAQSIIMQGIRSTMCVPLLHGSELLGIMHLDSHLATGAFSEKNLQVFTGIANQAAMAIQNARLARKIQLEAKTRAQFERFFSPGMVDMMVDGNLSLDGVGEMREVTILFADIRGFTSMTENADAHDIVALLNAYFEVMVEVLFRFEGTLDKYVGDEIMALFGVPLQQDNAAELALECAVELQQALVEFNAPRIAQNLSPIEVGIGVNTGMCVWGAIGSSKTVQYTVIGDAVNSASRLCSLAKGGEIICSQDTYERVSSRIEAIPLPPARVKGKQEEIGIYRVVGVTEAWARDYTSPGAESPTVEPEV